MNVQSSTRSSKTNSKKRSIGRYGAGGQWEWTVVANDTDGVDHSGHVCPIRGRDKLVIIYVVAAPRYHPIPGILSTG